MDENDREILKLYKDELRDLEKNAERLESNLFDIVGSFEPPGIEQRVLVSIFPKNGLEAAVSVGHLAEFYRSYFDHNDWVINSYREVPYGAVKPKMVGDPFELIEFEISGPDVIQILRLENGVHKFKRKSLNTSNAVAGLTYNCQVHTRPILTKVKRENVEAELEIFISESRCGEYISQYDIHIKDPIYGFSLLYKGEGTLQENRKKAIAEMSKKIKNFEMEKFQSSKADLEKSMSLETVRLYDYINNRIQCQDESYKLSEFLNDHSILTDLHFETLATLHEEEVKSLFSYFDSIDFHIEKTFSV